MSVINVDTITGTATANDSVTVAGTAAVTWAMAVNLGAGTDTLTITNTAAVTLSASGVETITLGSGGDNVSVSGAASSVTGGVGADTIIVADTYAYVIDGGSGSDTVTLASSSAHTLTLANVETVTGSSSLVDTVTFSSAATATLSNVDYVYGSAGADRLLDSVTVIATAPLLVSGGDGDDTINLAMTAGVTSSAITISASVYGGAGSDVINVSDVAGAMSAASTAYVYEIGGAGADTISLHQGTVGGVAVVAGANWTVHDVVRVNLSSDLASGTTLSLADTITGFTASDILDLTGVTLTSAANSNVSLIAYGTTGDNFATQSLFTSTTATLLADLTTGGNENAVYINATDVVTTGSFTNQTGIDAAVTFITTNIGKNGTAVGEKAIIAVEDGTNTALFYYVETGTTGIQPGELTLVGVLVGQTIHSAGSLG